MQALVVAAQGLISCGSQTLEHACFGHCSAWAQSLLTLEHGLSSRGARA